MSEYVEIPVRIALLLRVPRLGDGSFPAPDEAKECVLQGLRGYSFDDANGCPVEIVDTAPFVRDLDID
jgi:hypothetical protein